MMSSDIAIIAIVTVTDCYIKHRPYKTSLSCINYLGGCTHKVGGEGVSSSALLGKQLTPREPHMSVEREVTSRLFN